MADLGVRAYRFSIAWPRVAADRVGRGEPGRPRLLLAAGRRAARRGHRAGRDALPLGPAAGARGRRRLDEPRHRRALRRLRARRRRGARRPGRDVHHAQRAVVLGVPRLRHRRARARRTEQRRRARRGAPPLLAHGLGGVRAALGAAARRRRSRSRSTWRMVRAASRVRRGPRRRAPHRRHREPDLPRPDAARQLPRGRPRRHCGTSPTGRSSATATWRPSARRSTCSASTTTRPRLVAAATPDGRRAGDRAGSTTRSAHARPTPWPGTDLALALPQAGPHTAMDWRIEPASLTELLLRLHRDYPDLPLMITENGAAFDDVVDGRRRGARRRPRSTTCDRHLVRRPRRDRRRASTCAATSSGR